MTTYTVTNTSASGVGSLAMALQSAMSGDTIQFQVDGSITLSGATALPTGSVTFDTTDAGGTAHNVTVGGGPLADAAGSMSALVTTGAGTLTLSATNSYSGGTTITAGTLVAGHLAGTEIDALGGGGVTLNGGTLSSGGLLGNALVVGANGGTLSLNTSVYRGFNIAGAVTGSGTLNLVGSNLFLSGDESGFSGTTTLASGTVVQADDSLSALSPFQFAAGATLTLATNAPVVASLADSGLAGASSIVNVLNGSVYNAVTLGLNGTATTSFSGEIQDGSSSTLALSKNGTGTQTLSGTSTYSGGTTIDGGILDLSGAASTTNGNLTSGPAGKGGIAFGTVGPATLRIEASAYSTNVTTVTSGTNPDGTHYSDTSYNAGVAQFSYALSGFTSGDAVDLVNLNSAGATASFNGTTLTVTSGAQSDKLTINPAPSGYQYTTVADTAGTGTDVVLTAIPPSGGGSSVSTTPTPGPDSLTGTSGNDTIAALAGDDTVNGVAGNDLILGNQGNDIITVGDGMNTVYGGMDNDRITVGNGNNLLFGDEGSDTITAGNGNNTIVGGIDSTDGADLITSGSGNDLILGNGGDDTVSAGAGNDSVLGGYGNDVLLGNQGNDIVLGNQGDDVIYGGYGDDTLVGGQGDDTLIGGQGNDVLYGNEGANRFVFNPGDTNFVSGSGTGDVVMDFKSGTDSLHFSAGPAGTPSDFGSASVAGGSFASLQSQAQTLINGGDAYAFVSDGTDGYLFTTAGNGGGTGIEDVVKLAGVKHMQAGDIV